MAEVTPPPIDRFELTNGHLLNAGVARDDIEGFYRSFGRHSESDLPRQRYETDEDYEHMSGSRLMSISRIMKKPSLVLSLRIRQRVGIQRYALEDGPRTGLRNVMESIGRKDPRSNGRSVRNFSMIEMKKKRRIGNSSASKEWQLNTSLTFFNTDLTWVISSTRDTADAMGYEVQIRWLDTVTKEIKTTWEVPSKAWRLLRGRDKAEEVMLKTANKRAEISRELEERNNLEKRWKSPSPDAWARARAGTGMGTTSTAIQVRPRLRRPGARARSCLPTGKIHPRILRLRRSSRSMIKHGLIQPHHPILMTTQDRNKNLRAIQLTAER
ncbi:hypothetical protein PoMZ_13740 [Pyricularia oryzae]|uniref:Uncharacterized protein n=1 Tax=Pyricularia oryzae TaxID=318829 RepID=A0A4P7NWA9_PYROR|nr:hypothetical protein PoMZ_13740 [Pyricularia oryzae]